MDQMALAAIVQTTRGRSDYQLHARDSAKEAWDPLKEMNMGEERIQMAQLQTLKRELDGMYMGDSE